MDRPDKVLELLNVILMYHAHELTDVMFNDLVRCHLLRSTPVSPYTGKVFSENKKRNRLTCL